MHNSQDIILLVRDVKQQPSSNLTVADEVVSVTSSRDAPHPSPTPLHLRASHRRHHHHHLSPFLARLIVSGGILSHLLSLRRVVDLLTLSPDLPSSLLLSRPVSRLYFPLFPSSSTFFFNLLIRAFSLSRLHAAESVAIFATFLRCGGSLPDSFTFPFLCKAFSSLNSPREGPQAHAQVTKRGFLAYSYAVNTLLTMYSTFGDMCSAQKLFDSSLEVVDVVSWNTVIDGYVKSSAVDVARKLFDEMPVRNEVSWSSIISGYVAKGELDVAQLLFDRMPVKRNVATWNSMVSGFARHGLLGLARKMFNEMPVRNVVSWNSMISGYTLNAEIDKARELFNVMPEKDVVSWSTMISGYTQTNHHSEALKLFEEMQRDCRVRPNEVTMVSVLSACATLLLWIKGVGPCLHRQEPDGLAINGASHESLEAFELMRRSGINPDDITFLGVLIACTHGGLVHEGRRYFESMTTVYGLRPEMKHYGCMVDLLARAGFLEEAEELIRSMPYKPDVMVLGALLGACRIYRAIDIADRVRSEFLPISQQSGCHVLLSNIYAAAGRWADALEMRSSLKRSGARKFPKENLFEQLGVRSLQGRHV
uniref:Pentatricopeptide repeat-containing protein n=1 Tax=Ananas comosus var. bracteatus TaxID=296719 RepID=A0A6V7QRV9_ANACO